MKWQRGHRSAFVEDRRGRGGGRLSLGGIVIALILYAIFGRDVTGLLSSGELAGGGGAPASTSAEEAELVDFVNFVLDDIQGTWERQFRSAGETYRPATLVLFTDRVQSACGIQGAAVGPFYCGADHKAYIDLGFYRDLKARFGAPGDFAQAYVLAHEIGHHIQNVRGISAENRRRKEAEPGRKNELSIRQELQADCLAGVWGHSAGARGLLDEGDVEEGLAAAAAIGDDRLQRQATGVVTPESWTHGASEQRVRWFRRGLESGDPERCDTFSAAADAL
ncbi:MAG: neutral zinc metallopeptidase [Myxococcales bacterium]|nr:neutral zinc metallopeptidase [Myxococcales bacterium]